MYLYLYHKIVGLLYHFLSLDYKFYMVKKWTQNSKHNKKTIVHFILREGSFFYCKKGQEFTKYSNKFRKIVVKYSNKWSIFITAEHFNISIGTIKTLRYKKKS